uniref:Adenylyl-sulfate kinase n=1 Tax=Chlorobium chlorochromatii (strain CaD3) TaxID=340177 RepID=Q3ASM3_CHLCH
MNQNIFPVFDEIAGRSEKEQMLQQHGCALWFIGLSGSGKTTIARHIEQLFLQQGILTQLLDADNIRTGLNNNLGFSEADRVENIRRVAEVTKLFVECGIVTLNCFITPTNEIQAMVKDIVGKNNVIEIFVDTPLSVCESRDVKGLYRKAREGQVAHFTGISSPFEPPQNPSIHLQTNEMTLDLCVQKVVEYVLPKIH